MEAIIFSIHSPVKAVRGTPSHAIVGDDILTVLTVHENHAIVILDGTMAPVCLAELCHPDGAPLGEWAPLFCGEGGELLSDFSPLQLDTINRAIIGE